MKNNKRPELQILLCVNPLLALLTVVAFGATAFTNKKNSDNLFCFSSPKQKSDTIPKETLDNKDINSVIQFGDNETVMQTGVIVPGATFKVKRIEVNVPFDTAIGDKSSKYKTVFLVLLNSSTPLVNAVIVFGATPSAIGDKWTIDKTGFAATISKTTTINSHGLIYGGVIYAPSNADWQYTLYHNEIIAPVQLKQQLQVGFNMRLRN